MMLFVLLAEVLIFVPSVARFREDYLLTRLERGEIASLALLASDGAISAKLAEELLNTAGVYNVVLRRDAVRELVLSSPVPRPVVATYDLRTPPVIDLLRDGILAMFAADGDDPDDRRSDAGSETADRSHDERRTAARSAALPCAAASSGFRGSSPLPRRR